MNHAPTKTARKVTATPTMSRTIVQNLSGNSSATKR
jgi:hypothetical protein